MATWRRKDLERRSVERGRRMGRVLRAEILVPVLALLVAGVALWQALAAQSRAEVLARDLSLAYGQQRNLGSYGAIVRPSSGEGGEANPPLPPLPPFGPAPSQTSPTSPTP